MPIIMTVYKLYGHAYDKETFPWVNPGVSTSSLTARWVTRPENRISHSRKAAAENPRAYITMEKWAFVGGRTTSGTQHETFQSYV